MVLKAFTDMQERMNETQAQIGNHQYTDLLDYIGGANSGRLCRVAVDLTAAAQTTLFTVPSGYKLIAQGVNLVGKTVQSGSAKESLIKVGTSGNSYQELLDAGHLIQADYAATVVAANKHLPFMFNRNTPRLLSRTLLDLTATGQSTLYTVPTDRTAVVNHVILEGNTAMSGGTSSKVVIGTTGSSYDELLDGTNGLTFTSGTASSLLAVGARLDSRFLPGLTSVSTAPQPTFSSSASIRANVTGTVLTAGDIYVELWGNLDDDGPKEFAGGTVIQADVSGSALLTAGEVYAELYGRLVAGE